MEKQHHLTSHESRAVLGCLQDLAKLTSKPEAARVALTETRSVRVLAHLLALSAAPQGLLALSSSSVLPAEQALTSSVSQLPHLLACHHLSPAEALLILQAVPLLSLAQPVVRDTTAWLPVSLPVPLHSQIWIILGWPLAEAGKSMTITRAQRLLPFVVDLASTILMQALQHEHPWVERTLSEPATDREEMHQQMRELFEALGHEFRTPLTTIRGYTDSLARHFPRLTPEECQEFLQAIQQAERRLEVITTRLLEAAQLEAGGVRLDVQPLDLPSLLRRTINMAQQWVPASLQDSITFHLQVRHVDGSLSKESAPILGNPSALSKVFEHVLENAIRFSPAGGRVDIIVRPAPSLLPPSFPPLQSQQPALPRYLETCICDYGMGIPQEHLARVFERFHRVDTQLTREVGGLGLGLTICQYLVALHHGYIWAESCPDGGCAFHLWLPIAQSAANL